MVFKHPGIHEMHGDKFDYLIVDDDDIESALADGWSLTTDQAKHKPPAEPPISDDPATRAELEQKAGELGIKFDGRTSDAKLAKAIADALAA